MDVGQTNLDGIQIRAYVDLNVVQMEQIMRMFVTGSTGLLGNNLVRRLLENGHEVLALARSKDKAAQELGEGLRDLPR